jgi:hypothetical protein
MMTSVACAGCHPAIYAEHTANTHGRAFHDDEARLATRGFRREDCVRCHTPRPVFETGIGLTPMQRWTDLEEGNTCMSCHWRSGYDYSRFVGGKECKEAFDPRVGTVQACASCHRIAGTPDQWSRAAHGAEESNVCIDCHMPAVERPVAVGEPPRLVRSHVFPASRSESQLRRAYAYAATIEGNEVVVRLTNKGAGHNFPTATRQRAVESLVTIRDRDGNEIGRSRMTCRYPYASELAEGQLTMPVSTQVPSGKMREQRVPIPVAEGTATCELFFKLYRPIDDRDPNLSRRLEVLTLPFSALEPSQEEIHDAPFVGFPAPAGDLHDFFSPESYVNVARPVPGTSPVEIPEGQGAGDIARLVALLEFHLPEARRLARERLDSLGPAAVPALVRPWLVEQRDLQPGDRLPGLEGEGRSPRYEPRPRPRALRALPRASSWRIWTSRATATCCARSRGQPRPPIRSTGAARPGARRARRSPPPRRCAPARRSDPDVVVAAARGLALLDAREAVPDLRAALAGAGIQSSAPSPPRCASSAHRRVPAPRRSRWVRRPRARGLLGDLVAVTGMHSGSILRRPRASASKRSRACARPGRSTAGPSTCAAAGASPPPSPSTPSRWSRPWAAGPTPLRGATIRRCSTSSRTSPPTPSRP